MKKYYIWAAVIAILDGFLYPILQELALLERGYQAIGGEELVFILGLFGAVLVVIHGFDKKTDEYEIESIMFGEGAEYGTKE